MNTEFTLKAWQRLNKVFNTAVEYAAVIEEEAGFEKADEYFKAVVEPLAEVRQLLEKEIKK